MRKRSEVTDNIIGTLVSCFPLAFAPDPEKRAPLKVGIGTEVAALLSEHDRREVGRVLHKWTSEPNYLRKCIVGAWSTWSRTIRR
jgi:sRNA-binding protein